MFIGHYSVALAAATHPKAPRLGSLFIAAQLVDFGFFGLVLAGVEKLRIVPGITVMNPLDLYHMPFTHSLAGGIAWGAAFALFLRLFSRDWIAPLIGGAVVVSHWVIDLLVHRPDLTLWGSDPKFGLGLWNHPMIAMPLEILLVGTALILFWRKTEARAGAKNWAFITLAALMALVMVGDWFGPKPTEAGLEIAIPAFASYALLALIAYWVSKTREVKA